MDKKKIDWEKKAKERLDHEVVVNVSNEGHDDVDESEEENVSPAAKDDSCEETLLSTDEETEDEDGEEYASLLEKDASEDESEEELELTEKSEKAEGKGEIGLKRKGNANGGDQHSFSDHDVGNKSQKAGNEKHIEAGTKRKAIDDGDGMHSSATLDTDVRSEKVLKEGSVGIELEKNLDVDGDAVIFCSSHDVHERSVQVGKVDNVLAEEKDEICVNGNYDGEVGQEDNVLPEEQIESDNIRDCYFDGKMGKGESVGVGSVGNESGDRNDLHSSSVHRTYDRCDNSGKENSMFAEEIINRRGGSSDGKMWKEQNAEVGSVGYEGNGDGDDQHSSFVQPITDRCDNVGKTNTDIGRKTAPKASNALTIQTTEYVKGRRHGTTILWFQLPTQLLVGVDSQTTQTFKSNVPNTERSYELLTNEEEVKFQEIMPGVHATFCGDGDRIKEMVDFVNEEMRLYMLRTLRHPTLRDIGVAATEYFRSHPMDSKIHKLSIIYMCRWMPDLNRYHVIEVGDAAFNPLHVQDRVFGCGSGSEYAIKELKRLDNLRVQLNENIFLDQLIKATFEDPHTGGRLKVFSLKNGGSCEIRRDTFLLNQLHIPLYADMLFDSKSMFLIILSEDAHIMCPTDILKEFASFDPQITVTCIHWLCVVSSCFLVYRVVLSSPQCCQSWFGAHAMFKGPIRRGQYSINDGSCEYYFAYATRDILDRILGMSSFQDLA